MRHCFLPLWSRLRSRPLRFAVLALLAGMLLLMLWVATVRAPDFSQFKQHSQSSEAWLLDRHGAPLQRLRLNHDYRRLDWVPLAEISPRLQQAILVAEDKRFYQHAGVDPWAILSAMRDNLQRSHQRGASTLTMQ
jgi:penicillin-binding protein 1C